MRSLLAGSCPLLVQSFHLASVYWDYNYSTNLRCDGWPSLDGSIAMDACTRADEYFNERFQKYVHESSSGLYPKVSRQIFLDAECSQPDVDSTLGPITYSIDPLNDCECSARHNSCLGVRLFRPETLVLARRLDLCLGSADDRGVGLNHYAGGPTLDTRSWHFLSDGTLKQGDYSCLDGGNMTNGSPVTMEQCEASKPSQKWQLQTVDRCAEEECPLGTFQVALTNTPADSLPKCLDVPGGDVTPGKPLWIWDCQEAGSAALRNQLFFTSRQSPPSPIDSITV